MAAVDDSLELINSTQVALSKNVSDVKKDKNSRSLRQRHVYGRLKSVCNLFHSLDIVDTKTVCGKGYSGSINVVVSKYKDDEVITFVSSRHFEVLRNTDHHETFIRDTSTNGTYVNQEKVLKGQTVPLRHGDIISLAFSNLDCFVYEEHLEEEYPKKIKDKYIMTGVYLGKGSFGKVLLARLRSDFRQKFAVKIISKSRFSGCGFDLKRETAVWTEIRILLSLRHPNIVHIKECVEADVHAFLVLEYVAGGDFFTFIVDPKWGGMGLGDYVGQFYAYQLLTAVEYLHQRKICHRDIKPENILMESKQELTIAKLTDFGLSKPADESVMRTLVGTEGYIPPEMLSGTGCQYTDKVDIWSLGVVLFIAFAGYQPFSEHFNEGTINQMILRGKLNFTSVWCTLSVDTQSNIRRMLCVEPYNRPTAQEVLCTDWMKGKPAKEAKQKMCTYWTKRLPSIC